MPSNLEKGQRKGCSNDIAAGIANAMLQSRYNSSKLWEDAC